MSKFVLTTCPCGNVLPQGTRGRCTWCQYASNKTEEEYWIEAAHDNGQRALALEAMRDRLVDAAQDYVSGHHPGCVAFSDDSCNCGYSDLRAAMKEIGDE